MLVTCGITNIEFKAELPHGVRLQKSIHPLLGMDAKEAEFAAQHLVRTKDVVCTVSGLYMRNVILRCCTVTILNSLGLLGERLTSSTLKYVDEDLSRVDSVSVYATSDDAYALLRILSVKDLDKQDLPKLSSLDLGVVNSLLTALVQSKIVDKYDLAFCVPQDEGLIREKMYTTSLLSPGEFIVSVTPYLKVYKGDIEKLAEKLYRIYTANVLEVPYSDVHLDYKTVRMDRQATNLDAIVAAVGITLCDNERPAVHNLLSLLDVNPCPLRFRLIAALLGIRRFITKEDNAKKVAEEQAKKSIPSCKREFKLRRT